jgi:hypothetical protein
MDIKVDIKAEINFADTDLCVAFRGLLTDMPGRNIIRTHYVSGFGFIITPTEKRQNLYNSIARTECMRA